MLRPALVSTLVLAAPACAEPFISGAQARQLVQEGAVLLDVRTPQEFAAGHLPRALNIPVDELQARLGELKRAASVVLYCRSGNRSARGKAMLEAAGFSRVYNLGGMSNWN